MRAHVAQLARPHATTRALTDAHIHTHIHACIVYARTLTHAHTASCPCTQKHARTRMYIHICRYIRTNTHVCARTHMRRVCMHTHADMHGLGMKQEKLGMKKATSRVPRLRLHSRRRTRESSSPESSALSEAGTVSPCGSAASSLVRPPFLYSPSASLARPALLPLARH